MQIPVYLINLKRSAERRDHAIRHLKELGVQFQIIEAVDGLEISDSEMKDPKKIGLWKDGSRSRLLFKGDFGCVLSHLKIYQKLIDENIKMACILEDDIECEREFGSFLNYDNLNMVSWDLLYLGHHTQYSEKETWGRNREKIKLSGFGISEPLELPRGSYAYIITREAAIKILENVYPIRMSMDCYLGNSPAIGIHTRLLTPVIIRHIYSFDSTISQQETLVYSRKFVEYLRKQIRKTYKWFPFLQVFHIWINVKLNLLVKVLRRTGLLRNSYANYN